VRLVKLVPRPVFEWGATRFRKPPRSGLPNAAA
jgi:hypothetical protein